MIGSIKKGNYDWVINRIDSRITFSFGFNDGIEELRSYWKQGDDGIEGWMDELRKALELGGQFVDGSFQAPYTWSSWPDELEAFEHAAVIKKNAKVFKTADLDSEVLSKLSLQTVRVVEFAPDYIEQSDGTYVKAEVVFHQVEYEKEKVGFMLSTDIRSPIDYRGIFRQVNGSWHLMVFVAGD
jgi:hypothetical protein